MRRQRRPRRHAWSWARLALGPSLTIVVGVGLVIGLDSDSGRVLLARAITAASAGRVEVSGLGGSLPFAPRIERLVLADELGPWLRINDAALSIDPSTLRHRELSIHSLSAESVTLLRRPAGGNGAGMTWPLPFAVRLDDLRIGRLKLTGLSDTAPELRVRGSAVLAPGGALLGTVSAATLSPNAPETEPKSGQVAGVAAGQVDGELAFDTRLAKVDLRLHGCWNGAPVAVQVTLDRTDAGDRRLALGDSRWADIGVAGELRWSSARRLPVGELAFDIAELAALGRLINAGLSAGVDPGLSRWLGPATLSELGGRLEARLSLDGQGRIEIDASGAGLQLPWAVRIDRLRLQAAVDAPLEQPWTRAEVQADGLRVDDMEADLALQAQGPADGLELRADGELRLPESTPSSAIRINGNGRLQPFERALVLDALRLERGQLGARLLAPARVDLADGLTVDAPVVELLAPMPSGSAGRTLGLPQGPSGQLGLSGRFTPALALDARLIDLPIGALTELLAMHLPLPAAVRALNGMIDLEARLDGSVRAPQGRVDLLARSVRSSAGLARGLAPGELQLAVLLGSRATTIEARAEVGPGSWLELSGQLSGQPTSQPGRPSPRGSRARPDQGSTAQEPSRRSRGAAVPSEIALRARGGIDAALLNPILSASGRALDGELGLDLGISGRMAQPLLSGSVRLRDGAWRDRRLGLVLTGIEGELQLSGDRLAIEGLRAAAGPGSMEINGRLGWLGPERPVDLELTARNASPLETDALQLRADADLRLRGELDRGLALSGRVELERIAVQIPDRLPVAVATLEVQEVGSRRQPRPERRSLFSAAGLSPATIGLDLRIRAPSAITLSGRGIDAELGGEITAVGSLAEPAVLGSFRLLRGDYLLAGQRLRFTRGRIGFDGASVLDPTLDLEARVQAAGATAILAVEGTARAPEIRLSGEPEMPEDEVLSRLLFGLSRSRLSALQAARLGLAAASLAGIDGPAVGLLERARRGLGLDRLGIGRQADGARADRGDAVLEGGRYLGERVYLGARQGSGAGEPQGVLRMELSPRIRLETDVGADRGARAGAAFELEY